MSKGDVVVFTEALGKPGAFVFTVERLSADGERCTLIDPTGRETAFFPVNQLSKVPS